jgi:hypothetical protein
VSEANPLFSYGGTMAEGVLLFENKGHRIVFSPIGQELILEYKDYDSLGAEYWKPFRTIPSYLEHGPGGGRRQNMMYEFLCNIFEATDPVPQALQEEYQHQAKRRLEV